jgi:dTMP kinase
MLHTELARWGLPVAATREPSDSALGKLARHGTDDYQGLVLACLVAADRYHHLEHDIRPAVHAGWIVICDRYVPTSLVLQRIDGIEPAFLTELNQYADQPDLTIVLTGHPEQEAARLQDRGPYSRFHQGGSAARIVEVVRDAVLDLLRARSG